MPTCTLVAHTTERERKRNFTEQALWLTDVTALTDSYNVIHTPVSSLAVCVVWSQGCVRITQLIQSIQSNAPHLTFSNDNGGVTAEKVIS